MATRLKIGGKSFVSLGDGRVRSVTKKIRKVEAQEKRKHMVIMVGGPASGKGFFLGEPEEVKQKDVDKGKAQPEDLGKVKKGTGFGYRLPTSTKGLFAKDDVPQEGDEGKTTQTESDAHLRAIQYVESKKHHAVLAKAHAEGKDAFNKALADHWYNTKDGKRVNMSSFVSYDKFDKDDSDKFYKSNNAFYVSMRAWHDESGTIDKDGKFHPKMNEKTGKQSEPFKDQARIDFEHHVRKIVHAGDSDAVVIDSAGEDIDAQDFEGQIAAGKAAGYEVSVVFLNIAKEDTMLSNMSRGFVDGKRMVDQKDIDNFFENYQKGIDRIKKANPHRFLQFDRRPPLTEAERKSVMKMMTHTPDGKPTFLADPTSKIRTVQDLKDHGANPEDVANMVKMALYKPQYDLNSDESWLANDKKPPKYQQPNFANPKNKDLEKKELKKLEDVDWGEEVDKGDKDSSSKKNEPKKEDKDLKPDEYHKVHNRCPPGYHWDGKHCNKNENEKMPMAASFRETTRQIASSTLKLRTERLHMANALENIMVKVVADVKKLLPDQVRGYSIEIEAGKGPMAYITMKGGSGDITALKELRPKVVKAFTTAFVKNSIALFTPKLTASNKGSDLVISVLASI